MATGPSVADLPRYEHNQDVDPDEKMSLELAITAFAAERLSSSLSVDHVLGSSIKGKRIDAFAW